MALWTAPTVSNVVSAPLARRSGAQPLTINSLQEFVLRYFSHARHSNAVVHLLVTVRDSRLAHVGHRLRAFHLGKRFQRGKALRSRAKRQLFDEYLQWLVDELLARWEFDRYGYR